MNIHIHGPITVNTVDNDRLNLILQKLELQMATFQQILDAGRAQTNAIAAQLETSAALIKEVRQLIAAGNPAGADELLAEMENNLPAIQAATLENTDLAHLVDSVNGEPAGV